MVILLMGVSGCGKTTIGRLLSEELGCTFFDADDFHPLENVDKLRRGVPLDDADRIPWLRALKALVDGCLDERRDAVLACSLLKETYRTLLVTDRAGIQLVLLTGARALIVQRLAERKGHFMNPTLIDSQLEALESPASAIVIDVSDPPEEIVSRIRAKLDLPR